jgi:hypothetical protein
LAVEEDASSKRSLRAFEKSVMLKLYESSHQKPAAGATPQDLEALEYVVSRPLSPPPAGHRDAIYTQQSLGHAVRAFSN